MIPGLDPQLAPVGLEGIDDFVASWASGDTRQRVPPAARGGQVTNGERGGRARRGRSGPRLVHGPVVRAVRWPSPSFDVGLPVRLTGREARPHRRSSRNGGAVPRSTDVVLWMTKSPRTVYGPARRGAEHGDAPSRAFRTRPLPPSRWKGPCRVRDSRLAPVRGGHRTPGPANPLGRGSAPPSKHKRSSLATAGRSRGTGPPFREAHQNEALAARGRPLRQPQLRTDRAVCTPRQVCTAARAAAGSAASGGPVRRDQDHPEVPVRIGDLRCEGSPFPLRGLVDAGSTATRAAL